MIAYEEKLSILYYSHKKNGKKTVIPYLIIM